MNLSDYATQKSHLPIYYTRQITGEIIIINVHLDENGVDTGKFVALQMDKNAVDTGVQYFNNLQEVDKFRNMLILNQWKITFVPKVNITPR